MKAFIWNTEYEVLVAVAMSQDSARMIIKSTLEKQEKNRLIKEKDLACLKTGAIPSYVHARASSAINQISNMISILFARPADIVIEEGSGIIYEHENE